MRIPLALIALIAGCSSSGSGGGVDANALPTDSHSLCVTPTTTPQDVALPDTGGLSGTLSLAGYPAGTTGCLGIKIETGANIRPASIVPLALHPLDVSAGGAPLVKLTVGDATGEHPLFGTTTIVTGMVFKVPVQNLPDGTYYMSISKANGDGVRFTVIKLDAVGGVLTVAPLNLGGVFGAEGQNKQFPQITVASSTSVLTLYPEGVFPPLPGEEASPTPTKKDVSDAGLPPLPTDPPPTLDANPGAHGLPPPVRGTAIGYAKATFPPPGCTGNEGCSSLRAISSEGGGTTPIDGIAGMTGTVTWEMNIAYMQIRAVYIDCPSDWDVVAGFNGAGQIVIPESHPLIGATCVINYSTVAEGDGEGYEFTVGLRGLDIGAH